MATHDDIVNRLETGQTIAPQDVPPAEALDEILNVGQSLFAQGETFLNSLFRPWNAYQVAIAVGLFIVAHLLRYLFAPRLHSWMRTREGWPKWRMRAMVVVHKRLRAIFFVALIWVAVLVMREVTWPSRSYILGVVANLALAWLIVLMRRAGYQLLDCQFMTQHLASMGAVEIDREDYLALLSRACQRPPRCSLDAAYQSLLVEAEETASSSPGKLIAQSLTQTS